MARSKSYKKNVICFEATWDDDLENRISVLPVLKLTSKRHKIKYILLTCNTIEELRYNLEIAKKRRGYGVLYLAFHGRPGKIIMGRISVEIEVLAALMGRGFKGWIVHFDCCATMDIELYRICIFMMATGVLMVTGYRKTIDWAESSAVDLLLLDRLQAYKDMRKFWDRFRRSYRDLIRITGFDAFHKEY